MEATQSKFIRISTICTTFHILDEKISILCLELQMAKKHFYLQRKSQKGKNYSNLRIPHANYSARLATHKTLTKYSSNLTTAKNQRLTAGVKCGSTYSGSNRQKAVTSTTFFTHIFFLSSH